MKPIRTLLFVIAAAAVSACAGPQTATRNAVMAPTEAGSALSAPVKTTASEKAPIIFLRNINIAKITVDVPRTLVVSEKNSRYPKGDIVWRGDMIGDRYEQVKAIVEKSAHQAAEGINGVRPVHMHIRVTRFHGVSEKTRYSTGGVHNMNFVVTLLDPETGAVLRPAREVVTNLDAFGGSAAIAADQRGETQKVRVTAFLTNAIRTELTVPGGYVDHNRGFFVALNRQ